MSTVTIELAGGGALNGFLARPDAGPAPAIVLLQEIFGVNQAMREIARSFAGHGYIVLTPDLFWRQQPGVELDPRKPEDRERAGGFMRGLDAPLAMSDCQAAITHARRMDGANGKVAVVGFCLGGRLAYQTAAHADTDAAVAYYGVGLETMLDMMPAMRAPLLLHIGGADHLCGPEQQAAILDAARVNPRVDAHVYPGASHAFRRPGGENYVADAAALADERTLVFLRTHLG